MQVVTSLTTTEDVALITFSNTPLNLVRFGEIFRDFANAGVNVDMISQTAPHGGTVNLNFTIQEADMVNLLGVINSANWKTKPMVTTGHAKINLFGKEMEKSCGVAATAITALAAAGVELTLITTSEVDISLLLPTAHLYDAESALKATFSL